MLGILVDLIFFGLLDWVRALLHRGDCGRYSNGKDPQRANKIEKRLPVGRNHTNVRWKKTADRWLGVVVQLLRDYRIQFSRETEILCSPISHTNNYNNNKNAVQAKSVFFFSGWMSVCLVCTIYVLYTIHPSVAICTICSIVLSTRSSVRLSIHSSICEMTLHNSERATTLPRKQIYKCGTHSPLIHIPSTENTRYRKSPQHHTRETTNCTPNFNKLHVMRLLS